MLYRLTVIDTDNHVKEYTFDSAVEARDLYNEQTEAGNLVIIVDITKLTERQLYDRAQLEEECKAIASQDD